MTISAPAAPSDVRGAQRPRVSSFPPSAVSTGPEAIELCAEAGLFLDPWQQFALTEALGERPDGKWSAFEVGVAVPRQNGKGGLLEARALAGLFLLDERLIIHSAHEFATAEEALTRMEDLLRGCPSLWKRVKTIKRSHGQEGVYLKNGQRLRYKTRTKGGGRGFTCDCLFLDEAMIVPEAMHGALLPTLSARPNPQVWYTGSAVDQAVHAHGQVFARVRERGLRGDDPGLAYFEWSLDYDTPEDVPDDVAADPQSWAQVNPGVGIRISTEHVGHEQRSMDPRTFAVERLGVGDWPSGDGSNNVIDLGVFDGLTDHESSADGAVCFTFDVSPDRSSACIAAAGARPDGLGHVEVIDHRSGTGWVVPRLAALLEAHASIALLCDDKGPAGGLVKDLEARGIVVETVSAAQYAQACGSFYDAVADGSFRHLGTEELRAAVRGAAKRPLGDAWAWSRKSSSVDITPLVACTLARWGAVDGAFGGGFSWD